MRNGPCARGMGGRGAPAGEGVRVRPLSGKERRGMGIAGGIYSAGGGGRFGAGRGGGGAQIRAHAQWEAGKRGQKKIEK